MRLVIRNHLRTLVFKKVTKGIRKAENQKKQLQQEEVETPDELFERIYNEYKEVNYNGKSVKMTNAEIAMRGIFQKMSQGKSVPPAFLKLWKNYEKRQWAIKKKKLYQKRDEEIQRIKDIEATIAYKKIGEIQDLCNLVFHYSCERCLTPEQLDNRWRPKENTDYEIIALDPFAEDDY